LSFAFSIIGVLVLLRRMVEPSELASLPSLNKKGSRRMMDMHKSLVATTIAAVLAGLAMWPSQLRGETAGNAAAGLVPTQLRCEYLADPLGIDVALPRLSWVLQAGSPTDRGQRQTAYQVLVASSEAQLANDQGDLWDSGKVASDATIQVEYGGKPLGSRMRCHWKVRVWDRDGGVSDWSKPAAWEMALLKSTDWKAEWIGDGKAAAPKRESDFFQNDPAPLLRKTFVVDKPVRRARLYMSGVGYGYARLNGDAVGDRVLDPGWTNYAKRVLYSTYDVTPQIVSGQNCLGLMLGNGWYDPLPVKMWGFLNLRKNLPVGRPRIIAQLEIEFADGTRQVVATDETWRIAPGPVLRNNVYLGEIYDARREIPLWDRPGCDDAAWARASIAAGPIGTLRAEMQPPIRVTAKLKPIARTEPKPGVFIFDMGQNFAGWARLRVRGPAGTAVKLRFGELLYPDGMLNVMTSVCGQIKDGQENREGAYPKLGYQSDVYILSGRGDEVYVPRFTWHGFRYVEVTGYPGTPAIDALEGLRLSADVSEVGLSAPRTIRLRRRRGCHVRGLHAELRHGGVLCEDGSGLRRRRAGQREPDGSRPVGWVPGRGAVPWADGSDRLANRFSGASGRALSALWRPAAAAPAVSGRAKAA
jgi:alpha-L-rhamnosidase